eukprot:scaffold1738_cov267-Chaetoceros_neogracile.AAC.4
MMMFSVASTFLLFLRSFSVATVSNHRALGTNTKWTQLGDDIDGYHYYEYELGYSVAMSGDGRTIVAGGFDFDENTDTTSGYALVMEYDNGSWSQLGDAIVFEGPGYWFGTSVAMSNDGRAIVVGELLITGRKFGPGCARVFEYSRGSWNQLGSDIDGEAAGDQFGSSVAMSEDGRTIAVGGPGNEAGYVRVFEYSDGVWNQLGADIDGEAAGDHFGNSVALSRDGKTVVVGGPFNGDSGDGSGHARAFEYNGGSWSQLGADVDGELAGDNFGYSVAMSGDGLIITVGGPSFQHSGHVRVLEYIGGSWNQLGPVIDGDVDGDRFGSSVSMSGDGRTIVAAALQNGRTEAGSGYARVFEYSSESWNQLGGDIDGEAPRFSVSMSQDGKTIVAGAILREDIHNSGQVRVYTRPTTNTVDKSFGFITIVGIVGGIIFFLAAGYFVWSRTLKTSSKTNHSAMELVSMKGERGVFGVIAEAVPGSLDVPAII